MTGGDSMGENVLQRCRGGKGKRNTDCGDGALRGAVHNLWGGKNGFFGGWTRWGHLKIKRAWPNAPPGGHGPYLDTRCIWIHGASGNSVIISTT